MINLAIDGNEANVENPVGSNVFALKLLAAIEELTRSTFKDQKLSVTVLLSAAPLKTLPKVRSGWTYKILTPKKFWTQLALPLHLHKQPQAYDVFFTPGHYAPRICPVPYMSAVMDTAYLSFPQQFKQNDLLQLTHWTKYSVQKADKVLAISEATKKDVIKNYKKPKQDILVAYPALPTSMRSMKDRAWSKTKLRSRFELSSEYIVYVGTFQPRKNLLKLIEAFEQLTRQIESSKISSTHQMGLGGRRKRTKQLDSIELVLAGKVGWLADPILKRVADSPFADRIITPGYVTDVEKFSLLKHAQCSVLVGLHEGFGIPALESMALGTVPVVSKTTSLPEVVGEGGILVDPESVTSISNGLYKAISLTNKGKAEYRRDMRKHMKQFSWNTSAKEVLETLIEIAG